MSATPNSAAEPRLLPDGRCDSCGAELDVFDWCPTCSDLQGNNLFASVEAAEAAVKTAGAVRDFAGNSYREACRLWDAAVEARNVLVKAYFAGPQDQQPTNREGNL